MQQESTLQKEKYQDFSHMALQSTIVSMKSPWKVTNPKQKSEWNGETNVDMHCHLIYIQLTP